MLYTLHCRCPAHRVRRHLHVIAVVWLVLSLFSPHCIPLRALAALVLLRTDDFSEVKRHTMPINFRNEGGASLHPGGDRFIAGGSDLWVRVFDFETGAQMECLKVGELLGTDARPEFRWQTDEPLMILLVSLCASSFFFSSETTPYALLLYDERVTASRCQRASGTKR